ncbi:metal ABC transporter ATP-binding protein [Planctomycetota bacterium]
MNPVEQKNEETIIECENLTVAYGQEKVLDCVDLTVKRGAFLPIVGPNGAGKTTLLRVILGLIKPINGKIRTPFSVSPPGYVPQQKAIDPLYPVTLRQIVKMGLYPKLSFWRRATEDDEQKVDDALSRVGLLEHDRKRYSELSGGMKQKTFVARALVSGAHVFIMDEPTSELDEESEHEVIEHLYKLSREQGKTVLLAVHGLDHVMGLTDTICNVEHGKVKTVEVKDDSGKGGAA